jgi:uncharacterized damage-inducible protein DinB
MNMAQSLVGEFDHESGSTRKVLERVPEQYADWTPNPKSKPLGELANHIAGLPVWVGRIMSGSEYDVLGAGAPAPGIKPWESTSALLAKHDKNVADARALIAKATDAQLMEPWSFKRGGEVVYTLPRIAALRAMVYSHTVHHRGQLTVYLRLKDVPLPGIYGPTADEM